MNARPARDVSARHHDPVHHVAATFVSREIHPQIRHHKALRTWGLANNRTYFS
jgi:hypothetical protein